MKYEDAKEYCDNFVRMHSEVREEHWLSNKVCASLRFETALVHKGIDELANEMGAELIEEPLENGDIFKYRYSFIYEGVPFVGFATKRLDGYGEPPTEGENSDV